MAAERAEHPLLSLVAAGQGATVVPARVLDDLQHRVTGAERDLGVSRTIQAVTRTATPASVSRVMEVLALSG